MNTYITTSGVGTEVNDISVKGLVALINKTKKCKKDISSQINLKKKNLSIDDFDKEEYDIIVDCLIELTGLESFHTVEDDDGCRFILFTDRAPWEYSEKEKNIKREDIKNIFKEFLVDVIPELEFGDLYIANYIMD